MKGQNWIFSVRYQTEDKRSLKRCAVVGPARASTVERALHLAGAPEAVRAEIRADETVRRFTENALDPEGQGFYAPCPFPTSKTWVVCIGSVHEVLL